MRFMALCFLSLSLTGCYKQTPSEDEAIEIGRQEISMALCGNRDARCVDSGYGKAHISERRNDNTNQITVTFNNVKVKDGSLALSGVLKATYSGLVVYDFDAENGETYIKEISLATGDGRHSVELCGHGYKFCRK